MPEADDKHTWMRCAANEGNLPRVKELLKEGASVDSTNFHKNTALHMAVFYGHKDVAETLIQNGAQLNLTNVNGQTPLQLASVKGYLSIVKMITKKGCKLDHATDYSGMTALHLASKEGQAEICQHLLDVGATEEIYDAVDKIPEYYAANYPTELVFKKYKDKKGGGKKAAKKQQPEPTKPAAPILRPTPIKAPVSAEKQRELPRSSKTRSDPPKTTEEPKPNPPKSAEPKADIPAKPAQPKADSALKPLVTKSTSEKPPEATPNKPEPTKAETIQREEVKEDKTEATRKQPSAKQEDARKPTGYTANHSGKEIPKYDTPTYNPEGKGQGDHTAGGGVVIPKYGKDNYDNVKGHYGQSGDFKTGNIQLVQDHSFHWSEDFKKRQQQSVFDRLGGGGRKRAPREPTIKEEAGGNKGKGAGRGTRRAVSEGRKQ